MITIEGVKRTYRTGETEVHALRGIDLDVSEGEFLSIAGPSGSGKTTLLNLIGVASIPSMKGRSRSNGVPVSRMNKHAKTTYRRENLGFIFQTYNLIPVLTAFENVSFVLSHSGCRSGRTQ